MPKNRVILLVNPPLPAESQAGSLKDIANQIMPLGLGYIASMLEKNGFNPKIIDCVPLNLNLEQAAARVLEIRPGLLGITATILSIDACKALARRVKELLPETFIVSGGPMFTSMPEKIMREHEYFDAGIFGEGEYRFLEITKRMFAAEGSNWSREDIDGLLHRDSGRVKYNPAIGYIKNLDELPRPARHLFPSLDSYQPMPGGYRQLPFAHMVTSRGCPYRCIFCDRSVFGTRVRAFSPEYVLSEIEELTSNYGVKEIKFYDDLFTFRETRVMEICSEILRKNIKITWSCSTRVDRVSEQMLTMMNRAGCWQIDFGLESGDDEILKKMQKDATVDDARRAIEWTKKAGINCRAYFVLGMPGETPETIRRTVKFAKQMKLDLVTFYYVVLYPGNDLYKIAQKEGKILHHEFTQYTSLIDTKKAHLHYLPQGMTESTMLKEISRAYRSYYFSPRYLLRQLFSIRSLYDINRLWKGFKSVLKL